MLSVLLAYSAILAALIFGLIITIAVVRGFAMRRAIAMQEGARRGLFIFHDGARIRSIDPIAAYLALDADPEFRFDLHIRRADDGEDEALRILTKAVHNAFGVTAFTEPGKPGLTMSECRGLLRSFVLYIDSQKKSTNHSSTAQPSMESTSQPSTEATTSDSLSCGSPDVALV